MTKLSDTQRVILSMAAQHEALLATPPAKLPAAPRQAVLRSMIGKGLLEEAPAPREAIALGWRQDEDGAWIALRITAAGLAAIGVEPEAALETQSADLVGALAEGHSSEPALPEMALLPTAPQGDSPAAFSAPPPSTSEEAVQAPQRPPVSPRDGTGRAAALRIAAVGVVAAWDAPERQGLLEVISALRDALSARTVRSPREPGAPRQPRTGTKHETVLALLRRDEGTTIAQVIEATAWQPHTVRGFLAGLKRKGVTVEVLERVRQVGPNKQGAKGSYSIYRIATAAPTVAG